MEVHPPVSMPDTAFYDPQLCGRCGHHSDWHRLDDSADIGPVDARARFRCLGSDFDGCSDRCVNFVMPVAAALVAVLPR